MTETGHVALVTGAGRNIGRAITLAPARQGCAVVVNARADPARCEAVAVAARPPGVDAPAAPADVGAGGGVYLVRHMAVKELRVTDRDEATGAGRAPIAGDVFRFVFEVEDNHQDAAGRDRPNIGRSKELKVEVLKKSDLERRINDRQLRIKEEVRKALQYQKRAHAEAREIETALRGPEKAALPEIAEQILGIERRQNRLTADLLAILAEVPIDRKVSKTLTVLPVTGLRSVGM